MTTQDNGHRHGKAHKILRKTIHQVYNRPAPMYLHHLLIYTYLYSYVQTYKQRLAQLSKRIKVKLSVLPGIQGVH